MMIQAITEPASRDSKDFLVRIAVTIIKTIGISVSAPYSIAVYLIANYSRIQPTGGYNQNIRKPSPVQHHLSV